MLELYPDKIMAHSNERDVSYFVLNFGGVFYEGPGIWKNSYQNIYAVIGVTTAAKQRWSP